MNQKYIFLTLFLIPPFKGNCVGVLDLLFVFRVHPYVLIVQVVLVDDNGKFRKLFFLAKQSNQLSKVGFRSPTFIAISFGGPSVTGCNFSSL
mmetsp:Transcript_9552/g.21195  ORF Transcript_9552/g.21195 Transcript_9552/m.21195 type:complete len:92 (-) Transcript_9552:1425-1700(-)